MQFAFFICQDEKTKKKQMKKERMWKTIFSFSCVIVLLLWRKFAHYSILT